MGTVTPVAATVIVIAV